jgi:hypothetical protein
MEATMHSERNAGQIYLGKGDDLKVFPDPLCPDLHESMHRMRYDPELIESADMWRVLAAAEAYLHLTTYPLGVEHTVKDLRQIRRVLKADKYQPAPGDGEGR